MALFGFGKKLGTNKKADAIIRKMVKQGKDDYEIGRALEEEDCIQDAVIYYEKIAESHSEAAWRLFALYSRGVNSDRRARYVKLDQKGRDLVKKEKELEKNGWRRQSALEIQEPW